MSQRNPSFLFSVVMPVYNTEAFLGESIQSVLGQTIGFEENIQLILVDDGSSDGSAALCRSFQEKYPGNIRFLQRENGGVSAARNDGLAVATGTWVNFLDSDDLWSADTFRQVRDFFEGEGRALNAISGRVVHFGRLNKAHILDHKFDGAADRDIVDLRTEYKRISFNLPAYFFRRAALAGRCFDPRLSYNEDAAFISEYFLDHPVYGLLKNAEYRYRMRADLSSASDRRRTEKHWYLSTPQNYYLHMIQTAKEKCGTIPKYTQYAIMFYLTMHLTAEEAGQTLTPAEMETFTDLLKQTLKHMDMDVIAAQKNGSLAGKLLAYDLKFGKDIIPEATWEDGCLYYEGALLMNLKSRFRNRMESEWTEGDDLILVGRSDLQLLGGDVRIFALDKRDPEIHYEGVFAEDPEEDQLAYTGEYILRGKRFVFTLPLKDGAGYRFFVTSRGETVRIQFEWDLETEEEEKGRKHYLLAKDYVISYKGRLLMLERPESKALKELKKSGKILRKVGRYRGKDRRIHG